jgi:hypothetical protein
MGQSRTLHRQLYHQWATKHNFPQRTGHVSLRAHTKRSELAIQPGIPLSARLKHAGATAQKAQEEMSAILTIADIQGQFSSGGWLAAGNSPNYQRDPPQSDRERSRLRRGFALSTLI